MNNLVKVENVNMVEMTSNKIAEMTGKRHADVLRDIKVLVDSIEDENVVKADLRPSTYVDKSNRVKPNYTLSKDGVMLLITGYSVSHRMKLIKYCNELEKQLQNQFKVPATFKWERASLHFAEVKGRVTNKLSPTGLFFIVKVKYIVDNVCNIVYYTKCKGGEING